MRAVPTESAHRECSSCGTGFVGHHIVEARLVDAARVGRAPCFQVTPAPLTDAIAGMSAVGAQWDDRLAALAEATGDASRVRRPRAR